MMGFRKKRSTVLICTDVASRGLDVKDITHVINYSLPRELDNYVHRIGRTARSGKTGLALSLVTPSHKGLIGRIERVTKSKMREGKLPTRKEIATKKVAALLPRLQNQDGHERAITLLTDSWKSALESMSKEELAARFVALSFPELFQDRATEAPAAEKAAPRAKLELPKPISRPEAKPDHKATARLEAKPLTWPKPKSLKNHRFEKSQNFDKPRDFGKPFPKKKFGADPGDRGRGFGDSAPRFRKGKWQDRFKGKEQRR
jgi:ATP-dependent RNA helicase DeaD